MFQTYKINAFWRWFSKNSDDYLNFENHNQEFLLSALMQHLRAIDKNLTFEFGISDSNMRELVISCDGISASIKSVKAVVAAAPALDNWKIIPFRQRKSVDNQKLDGIVVNLKDMFFMYSFNENNLINLTIYIKNYADNQRNTFLAITFLYLDHLIGEYDVMSKLGTIDVYRLEGKTYDNLLPITKLVDLCDSRQTPSHSH